jgi:hypothetical protein
MITDFARLRLARNAGMVCALAAAGCGIFYLVAAGAPARYVVVNAVAALLGIVALRGFAGAGARTERFTGLALAMLGASLLATALLGASPEEASRWIWVGPLSVQVSLVVLPFMIVGFARHPDALGTVGLAVAAAALALQPDRAMAGVLALGMTILAMTKPGGFSIAALAAAIIGFAVSFARPDTLPAVPYVDQILFTSFGVHLLAGAAVLLGSLLLLMPSIVGWHGDRAHRHVHLVFGAVWLGCLLAAALGNYPTPVVGYGGSAILGYFLSLSFLPTHGRAASRDAVARAEGDGARPPGLPKLAITA